jgi:hypothetical protein
MDCRPAHELAEVVCRYGENFVQQHPLPAHHLRVLRAIQRCRTAALGGHLDACEACGHQRISYNSCRNRHCPKCQATQRERWIQDRTEDLLPVPYFHVVFTLPEGLNALCLRHPVALYNLLLWASQKTLLHLGADPKHLGAKMGLISILHTWGQNLSLHPHVHCIVPAGGITPAGHWKATKSNGRWLFPAKVMSRVYRGKFVEGLKAVARTEHIALPKELINALYKTDWVVYAKKPFLGPKQVIEYLGRYTHRVAISNHRLRSVDQGRVSFSYKDYRQGGKSRVMSLEAGEFLRRFCLHILAPGFRKIRHYGLLASRLKPRLKQQQMHMGVSMVPKAKRPWQEVIQQATGWDVDACPCCKTGRMITQMYFQAHGPPVGVAFRWPALK